MMWPMKETNRARSTSSTDQGSFGSDISASVLPSVSSKSASHTSRSASVAICAVRSGTRVRATQRVVHLPDVFHCEIDEPSRDDRTPGLEWTASA